MKKLALLSGVAFLLVLGLVTTGYAVEKIETDADTVITEGWHHGGGGRRGGGWGGGRGGHWGGGYYRGGCGW